jgi:hypothetical protein
MRYRFAAQQAPAAGAATRDVPDGFVVQSASHTVQR